jgi:hypothetical protein
LDILYKPFEILVSLCLPQLDVPDAVTPRYGMPTREASRVFDREKTPLQNPDDQ